MLLIRGLIGGLFQLAILGALLLIPAGTWQWPRAIQFLAAYGLVMLVSIVAMARFAPASLEARREPPSAKKATESVPNVYLEAMQEAEALRHTVEQRNIEQQRIDALIGEGQAQPPRR